MIAYDFSDPGEPPINLTRVFFNLPCKAREEVKAFEDVLVQLHLLIENKDSPVGGFTKSSSPDAVFSGSWVSDKRTVLQNGSVIEVGKKVSDRHVILQIDLELDYDDEQFKTTIAELHCCFAAIYFNNCAGQKMFWVTAQRAVRFSFDKYEKTFSAIAEGFIEGQRNI